VNSSLFAFIRGQLFLRVSLVDLVEVLPLYDYAKHLMGTKR